MSRVTTLLVNCRIVSTRLTGPPRKCQGSPPTLLICQVVVFATREKVPPFCESGESKEMAPDCQNVKNCLKAKIAHLKN